MIRVWLARATRGLRWRDPQRAARLFMAFARAERSSHYDLLAAAKSCSDANRRGLYLRHASDEARHATMFALRAQQLAPELLEPRADYERLFERLGELGFLAFVHLGELRGRRQLSLYRDELAVLGDERGRALLDAVLVDEARHEAYTGEQLRLVAGSERAAARALQRAKLWESWRSWRRLGRASAGFMFGACMFVVYLCLWPLAAIERRRAKVGS
jgi:rubrerythrin